MANTPAVLDLDAKRAERARLRAAQREGREDTLPVVFGGEQIAELGAELPLDVFAWIKEIDVDFALLIRQVIDIWQAENVDVQLATADMLVSVLASSPNLPREVLDGIQAMGRQLLGEDGYAKFIAQRPSREDIGAFVGDVLDWYGVSLGESPESSPSSIDGGTSNPTSNGATSSTPEESGPPPVTPISSASADSSTSSPGSPKTA